MGRKITRQDARRAWAVLLIACLLLLSAGASRPLLGKQHPVSEPFFIGVLTTSWGQTPHVVGLREGLVALGYREDVDFTIGVRFTQGSVDDLLPAARDIIKGGAQLIFTVNTPAALAARKATKTIPIVFTSTTDPVGLGLVKGYAKPGGNVTGLTDLDLQIGPKRLQLFKQLVPGLRRVFLGYAIDNAAAVRRAAAYQEAGSKLGIKVIAKGMRSEREAHNAYRKLSRKDVDGLISPSSSDLNINGLVVETSINKKIPAMFGSAFMLNGGGAPMEPGGLVSYGPSWYESGRLAARMVDKIMRGVKPADIPVEVNTKLELTINMKAAKAMGLKIPPEMLFQADRIIR